MRLRLTPWCSPPFDLWWRHFFPGIKVYCRTEKPHEKSLWLQDSQTQMVRFTSEGNRTSIFCCFCFDSCCWLHFWNFQVLHYLDLLRFDFFLYTLCKCHLYLNAVCDCVCIETNGKCNMWSLMRTSVRQQKFVFESYHIISALLCWCERAFWLISVFLNAFLKDWPQNWSVDFMNVNGNILQSFTSRILLICSKKGRRIGNFTILTCCFPVLPCLVLKACS